MGLGWCKSGCLSCTQPAQDGLTGCTGFAPAVAAPCEDSLEATGACGADDQAALADAQNVGEKQDACGKKALGLSGINHDKFTSCIQSDLGISASCSECYYATADYGFKNCKAACLLGWRKSGCLTCTKPAQDDLATCAGFALELPSLAWTNSLLDLVEEDPFLLLFLLLSFIGRLCMPGAGFLEVRSPMNDGRTKK